MLGKNLLVFFFFQGEDGIRDFCLSRWLGEVYKRQAERASDRDGRKIKEKDIARGQ